MFRALSIVTLCGFGLLFSPGLVEPVHAQDVAAAGRAFQTAQRAELAEDYARAAEFYELADSLVPSPEALRSALRARREAGQNAIAAGHAEALIERYPNDDDSRELARAALEEVREDLARVRVLCGEIACRIVVDGQTVIIQRDTDHIFYVDPGTHAVSAEYPNGTTDPSELRVEARANASLEFESPPPPAEPAAAGGAGAAPVDENMGGISPWFFVTSGVLTAGVGVATIISGLQAVSAGDDFDNGGRTRDLFETADGLELQTNILIGATATMAAATVVFAILTDWDGDPDEPGEGGDEEGADVALGPGPGELGLGLSLAGTL